MIFIVKVTDAQISTKVLTADGETFTITVIYGPEAGIPEGARLEAEEILPGSEEYQQYYEQSARATNSDNGLSYARFFDIKKCRFHQRLQNRGNKPDGRGIPAIHRRSRNNHLLYLRRRPDGRCRMAAWKKTDM